MHVSVILAGRLVLNTINAIRQNVHERATKAETLISNTKALLCWHHHCMKQMKEERRVSVNKAVAR